MMIRPTAILSLALLAASSIQAEPWNITKVGEVVTDSYCGVLGNGDVAYATSPYGLLVLDVSDRTHPQVVRRIETDGTAGEMAFKDTLLILCEGYAGLKVFQITDPQEPVLIGVCPGVVGAYRLKLRDDLAFVACGRAGMNVVDLSDPFNPELIGYDDAISEDVALYNDYAYTSAGPMTILDISDPHNPSLVGYTGYETSGELACIDDNLVNDARIFSLEDPVRPSLIWDILDGTPVYQSGECFAIVDQYLWLPSVERDNREDNLFCLNLSNPADPEIVGAFRDTIGWGTDLYYNNGYLFHTAGNRHADEPNGISIIDVGNPEEPQPAGLLTAAPFGYKSLAAYGDYIYAADFNGHRVVYSINEGNALGELSRQNWESASGYDHAYWPMLVHDSLLIEITDFRYQQDDRNLRRQGLFILSLQDPTNPQEIGTISYRELRGLLPMDVVADGDYLYMGSIEDSLMAISLADPTQPEITCRGGFYAAYWGIDIEDSLLITAVSRSNPQFTGIVVWDKSDPTNLQILDSL